MLAGGGIWYLCHYVAADLGYISFQRIDNIKIGETEKFINDQEYVLQRVRQM